MKKKKKKNMNEAQDHVFHQISRRTKSKVQFPIKGFFFSKDLPLLKKKFFFFEKIVFEKKRFF